MIFCYLWKSRARSLDHLCRLCGSETGGNKRQGTTDAFATARQIGQGLQSNGDACVCDRRATFDEPITEKAISPWKFLPASSAARQRGLMHVADLSPEGRRLASSTIASSPRQSVKLLYSEESMAEISAAHRFSDRPISIGFLPAASAFPLAALAGSNRAATAASAPATPCSITARNDNIPR